MTSSDAFTTHPPELATEHFRRKWGWVVALGALFIIGGVFAIFNTVAATVVAIVYIAPAMIVAGAWVVVTAFQIRPWGRAALLGAIGALPLACGAAKLALAYQLRHLARWEMIAIAGALSLLLGVLILVEWPASGLYVLGLFLGVNLLFEGISWVAMGLSAKPAARRSY
jgi:uncharacterized membrane protein HdeD (DUF308 family)